MTRYVQQQCSRCRRSFMTPTFMTGGDDPVLCMTCWARDYSEPPEVPLDQVKRAAGDRPLPGLEVTS